MCRYTYGKATFYALPLLPHFSHSLSIPLSLPPSAACRVSIGERGTELQRHSGNTGTTASQQEVPSPP